MFTFDGKLADGREVEIEASEFSAPEPDVGFGGGCCVTARLAGTGFPVTLEDADERRFTNEAIDHWLERYDDYED